MLALALALGLAQAQDPTWAPCPLRPGTDDARAECTTVAVPLDHATRTGVIDLAVKRLKAPTQPSRGQLWFLTGGPGDSGQHDIANLDGLHDALPDLDLYTFDARGLGESAPIRCPAQQAPDSLDGHDVVEDEWDPCVDHVASTYPDRLPFLTTTQTAEDLLLLTDTFRQPDDEVYLWGVSYGSFLVNRTLVLRPDGWTGVVVDGLVPADWSFAEFDGGLDRVARKHLALCAEQPDCRQRLGSDPVAFAEDLMDRLEDGHCKRLGLDHDVLRVVHGVFLMAGGDLGTLVPPTLYRLDRCKGRDIRAFVNLFDTVFPEDEEGNQGAEAPSHNAVLQRQIAHADLWEPDVPSIPELQAAVDGAIATTEVTLNFAKTAGDWPTTPPDPLDDVFADSDVPLLLLHGTLDPTMPADRAADWMDRVSGPHQTAVLVPFAPHVAFNAGTCPIGITTTFFNDPTAPVDTSCLDDMGPPDFSGRPEFDEEVWGTDRWGDKKGCKKNGGAFLFLWLPLLRRRRPADHSA